MFKTKIVLVDKDWNYIDEYKSRFKPFVDEYIYLKSKYYKVLDIINTDKILTVVIQEAQNVSKKD